MLPGAGEFYAESYWKAAAFIAIEAAAWGLAYHFDKKGDRQTDSFQAYADEHWSVVRYAEWTLDNALSINPGVNTSQFQGVLIRDGSGTVVGVNLTELNRLESALGGWYSHQLHPHGDQQYYELIGKYQQYYQGWDDADPSLDTYQLVTQQLHTGTTRFTYYAGERGKANDFYEKATTFVTVAIVNHVLSAIDAAWSAGIYNSNIHASVGMRPMPAGNGYTMTPVATLSYDF